LIEKVETRSGTVVSHGVQPPFVPPATTPKQAVAPDEATRSRFGQSWRMPWSRVSNQERRLEAYNPTVTNIPAFLQGIHQFAPTNLTGDWLHQVDRYLRLTGVNRSVQRVEWDSPRAHIFKSATDHLWVFLPKAGGDLKVAWGRDPEEIYNRSKTPIRLSVAPLEIQAGAATVLKQMAVALAHRAA